ncbi:enoyl-CoA hydratase-related protein [Paraflavisolibacter sp. H34]|uniref:enoyl-CoA hydratase-related protein n=1 Tax=Huijunlia imazamoxiresistens TaxID=3127457 RepID=UPI00301B0A19
MSSILFEMQGSVAVITLNRPEKRNAIDGALAREFQEKLDACRRPEVRCVYITGAGTAFSSGQDLEEITAPNGPKVHTVLNEHLNPIVRKIRKMEKPVVAAVNGVAAGAGANIAISCDVVLAAKSAVFIQAFAKIGLVPDTGGTYFLPRLVGLQKALAMTMLGEHVSADDAERMGMIYKVLADETFAADSMKVAQALAQMPTTALYLTKKAMHQSFISSFEEQLHDEELLQQQATATKDFREGVQAFLEKRKPLFKGS